MMKNEITDKNFLKPLIHYFPKKNSQPDSKFISTYDV